MRGEGTSPTLERRLARALGEEGLHGPPQVLGREQLGELVGGDLVGAIAPASMVREYPSRMMRLHQCTPSMAKSMRRPSMNQY